MADVDGSEILLYNQLRLVVDPQFIDRFSIRNPRWLAGFLPSTPLKFQPARCLPDFFFCVGGGTEPSLCFIDERLNSRKELIQYFFAFCEGFVSQNSAGWL